MSKANRETGRRERAAAIQAEQARSERNRKIGLWAAVVVVCAIVAAAVFWYSGSSTDNPASVKENVPARIVSMSGAGPTSIPATSTSKSEPTLVIGKTTAPIKVVVYEDFLCPFCREFEEASRDFLHSAAAQGKVEVQYRPFHWLPENYSLNAMGAFVSALGSSSPESMLKFHDLLFDNQPYETASSFPSASQLGSWAQQSGADSAAAQSGYANPDQAYAKTIYDDAANTLKIPGTPSIYVNGKLLSGSSVTGMANTLQQMIAAEK